MKIDELLKLYGYKGYSIEKAKWKDPIRCCYCEKGITKGFRVSLKTDWGSETYHVCSKEHAEKLVVKLLASRLARDLTDFFADHFAAHSKLVMIARKHHGYVMFNSNVIYCPPENGMPEIVIRNLWPHVEVWIDYIDVPHRDLLIRILDDIALRFLGSDVELLLDLRHTPKEQIMEAKAMVRELYCKYAEYGFRPVDHVVCGEGAGQ